MFKVADYLIQAQVEGSPGPGFARLEPLDTRGSGPAWTSVFKLANALGRIALEKWRGTLAGVHVNMAERLSLARKCVVVVFCRSIGVPVALHLHAAQLHHTHLKLPGIARALARWALGQANVFIVLGPFARDFVVRELRVPQARVEVVVNGVPEPAFARRMAPAPGARQRLFFLGNLSERKGVSDLLRAAKASRLFAQGKVELVLAGGGDVAHYQALARELGLEGATRFIGWADQTTAGRLMADADALILPSYDEGLPLVILEATANGVAVICTPVAEIPHFLRDGQEAVFVRPGDIDGIAAAIDAVMSDSALRQRLEAGGRALYERQFSLRSFATNVAKVHRRHFGVAGTVRVSRAAARTGPP